MQWQNIIEVVPVMAWEANAWGICSSDEREQEVELYHSVLIAGEVYLIKWEMLHGRLDSPISFSAQEKVDENNPEYMYHVFTCKGLKGKIDAFKMNKTYPLSSTSFPSCLSLQSLAL